MTTCNRCGKAVGTNDWDIHTCTPKHGLCDDCETVSHCLKHGCIPKHQALEQMAQNARELGLDYESPQRQWVRLTDGIPSPDELEALSDGNSGMIFNEGFPTKLDRLACWLREYAAIEAKLKEKNKC